MKNSYLVMIHRLIALVLPLPLVAKPRAKDAGAVNRKIIELELQVEGLK